MISLQVSISKQELLVYAEQTLQKKYSISTAKNGPGEEFGSEKTPRGKHMIRAKIGANCAVNTIFKGRRPTGEIYTPELKQKFPGRDWILTRIFWLSGLEVGKNRLYSVDTMRRYVYIHGVPDDVPMGAPGSKGCIRMHNQDIIELFEHVPYATIVHIEE
jgi:lipoprotein-anchoring transpeptidase ErfK/SrfK